MIRKQGGCTWTMQLSIAIAYSLSLSLRAASAASVLPLREVAVPLEALLPPAPALSAPSLSLLPEILALRASDSSKQKRCTWLKYSDPDLETIVSIALLESLYTCTEAYTSNVNV